MKFLRDYGYCIWMGIALNAFADVHVWDWQFYAIIVPNAILVGWYASGIRKEIEKCCTL